MKILTWVMVLIALECISFSVDVLYFTYCRPTSFCIQSFFIRFFASQSAYCKYLNYFYNILCNNTSNILHVYKFYA